MSFMNSIPVIDLFAGPGGLGEGFSAFISNQQQRFKIALSIEKEENAHKTLKLRAFFRQFNFGDAPEDYYRALRGEISIDELYGRYETKAKKADKEAMLAELGKEPKEKVDERIRTALNKAEIWVLIGGPPCQAYSLAGRSRNKGNKEYCPEDDNRHFLYREYLRIIAEHNPPIFVMENVKGLLSSKVNGGGIFDQILNDLHEPYRNNVVAGKGDKKWRYHIFSLIKPIAGDGDYDPMDFVVKSENYGIPQARHRVIFLGVREDMVKAHSAENILFIKKEQNDVKHAIGDLPRVRSGLSHSDTADAWLSVIKSPGNARWLKEVKPDMLEYVREIIETICLPKKNRGNEFIEYECQPEILEDWFVDPKFKGVCNHSTRGHIPGDLYRYLFASCFASIHKKSPVLRDFPKELRPAHKNVMDALDGGLFEDRFRVQLRDKPATTVVSHISKDGHYYIHYDPSQCRSLTVREAARLQTFPDNYFFCGPRTSQYHQVGNAVPPYLAFQIAEVVSSILERAERK